MTTVITFSSQKGGVGKTTCSTNLSAALAIGGRKVLMVDLDPQGSIQASFGYQQQPARGIRELFCDQASLSEVTTPTSRENLDFIFSNAMSFRDEAQILKNASNPAFLKEWIEREAMDHYDFIVLDSPPSSNELSVSALISSDLIVAPLQCEALAIGSLKRFLKLFRQLQHSISGDLRIAGILMTMYDCQMPVHRQICRQIYKSLPASVFQTIIPRCPDIMESSAMGDTVFSRNLEAIGSTAYIRFANELLDRFHLR